MFFLRYPSLWFWDRVSQCPEVHHIAQTGWTTSPKSPPASPALYMLGLPSIGCHHAWIFKMWILRNHTQVMMLAKQALYWMNYLLSQLVVNFERRQGRLPRPFRSSATVPWPHPLLENKTFLISNHWHLVEIHYYLGVPLLLVPMCTAYFFTDISWLLQQLVVGFHSLAPWDWGGLLLSFVPTLSCGFGGSSRSPSCFLGGEERWKNGTVHLSSSDVSSLSFQNTYFEPTDLACHWISVT